MPQPVVTARYRVALVGFSAFEQQALESYFRLAAGPTPAFEPAASLADIDVLVVDDIDIARRLLQVQLQQLGCRVTTAESGADALERLQAAHFRIVFSDVEMKDMDGLALCQQIKQRRKGAPTVVLVSARSTPSDRVRATIAGADGFLGKPIDAAELVTVLRACSNRRRRAR